MLAETARLAARGRGPRRLRAARAGERPARRRPHRHRQRGPALPGRRRPAGRRRGIARPGGVVPVVGPVRRPDPRPTGSEVLPAGVPRLAVEAASVVRLGALRRRHRGHRPLRGVGPRRGGHARSSASPPSTSPTGPTALLGPAVDRLTAIRAGTADERTSVTTLHDLYDQQGQSPWLDNLRRDWLEDGTMAGLVARASGG